MEGRAVTPDERSSRKVHSLSCKVQILAGILVSRYLSADLKKRMCYGMNPVLANDKHIRKLQTAAAQLLLRLVTSHTQSPRRLQPPFTAVALTAEHIVCNSQLSYLGIRDSRKTYLHENLDFM